MIELKSCPFCGNEMNLSDDGDIIGWHKSNCFFNLLDEHEVDMTDDEIRKAFLEAWNRRDNR